MATIAKKHQEQLHDIKHNVKISHEYFDDNFKRYHNFRKMVYKTALTADDISLLQTLQKPQVEFNILEAYISRLRGEFSKMEPGFTVRAADGVDLVDPRLIKVVEAHLKAIFLDADNDSLFYDTYTDLLTGGFSVVEVYTDYINDMSFEQSIYAGRVFDPTLTGFDPMARLSHKGDGEYAFQCFPRTKESAVEEFGSDVVKDIKFTRTFENFEWSYMNDDAEIMMICDFYKKIFKDARIIKLSNGRVLTVDDYEKFIEEWDRRGYIEQPPIPVGKVRKTKFESICRYRCTGNKVIDYVETNYKYLPLVFFDGNSAMLRDTDKMNTKQMTRPYIYNARDTQKLKNFAGQTLANELENMIMHKWKAPVEGIPEDYKDAYINPQMASVVLYNAFKDNNPDVPLPPPQEVARIPTPPEVTNTFTLTDNLVQTILGTYDAALGINGNELSGVAIMQGAMHSNAAAMPYTMGFMKGLNRVSQIVIDLIPKYYVTPRTIPVRTQNGKRDYVVINKSKDPNSIFMNYDARSLEVKVEAGVNFAVQKQISLETIINLMKVSESFNQFINTEGLQVLLDNIDIRGIDNLRQLAEQFMQQTKQQQAQAQQMAQQQAAQQIDPGKIAQMQMQVEHEKIQQKEQESLRRMQVDMTKIATDDAVKKQENDMKFLEIMARIKSDDLEAETRVARAQAEDTRSAVDMAINMSKHVNELKENKGAKDGD